MWFYLWTFYAVILNGNCLIVPLLEILVLFYLFIYFFHRMCLVMCNLPWTIYTGLNITNKENKVGGHFHKDKTLWIINDCTSFFFFFYLMVSIIWPSVHKKSFTMRFTLWLNSKEGCCEYVSIFNHIYSPLIGSLSLYDSFTVLVAS